MNSSTVHTKRQNQTDTGQINLLPNQRWGCTTVSVWTKMVTWERLTDKFHRNISSFQHPPKTPPKTGQTKKFQQSVQFSPPPAFISISEAAVRGRLSMPMIREFVEGVDTRTYSPSLTFLPSPTHTISFSNDKAMPGFLSDIRVAERLLARCETNRETVSSLPFEFPTCQRCHFCPLVTPPHFQRATLPRT